MTITVISVGTKPDQSAQTIIDTYVKRLPKHITVQWQRIKHGPGSDPEYTKQHEAEKTLSAIPHRGTTILLDERGKSVDNQQLSTLLFSGGDICLIIGGAYGVAKAIFDQADYVIKLSDLILPHQLVRVIIAEQIYRSYTISVGHPYHHQ